MHNQVEKLIKAKEYAEESDRLKSAFLANMSHEIRTPMNAIIGFSYLLSKPDVTEYRRGHYTKLMKQNTLELLRIVDDILDISKIKVDQLKMIESDFVLSELMNDLYEAYQQKIKDINKCGIELKLNLDVNLDKVLIQTDKLRLKQVLNNLLNNALKFTLKGNIELGCEIVEGENLHFYVKDTGIGIPPEKQIVIFDPFRQAEDGLPKDQYGGTGLGLAISKGIVALLNGKMWVESVLNSYSIFHFSIPLVRSKKIMETKAEMISSMPSWEGKKLLIVEDNEANTEYIKAILSDTQINLLSASDGKETLQMVESHPDIDVILMDVRLPDTSGLELTKLIKEKSSGFFIIAQTAYAESSDVRNCMDAGCDSYISKPFTQDNLFLLLGQYFNKKY